MRGYLGLTGTSLDQDFPAKSSQIGTPWPTNELHRRVWSPERPGNPRVLRTHLMHLRRKLGEDGSNPMYIFAEPRVG